MAHLPHPHARSRWAHSAVFLLLCLLLAIGSIRADLFPGSPTHPVPQLEREALPLALLAITAALFSIIRGAKWPRGRQLGLSIALGLGLFAVPAILIHFAQSWVSAFTRITLFSLAPVFAVVLEPHIDLNLAAGSQSRGSLFAALAAVTGTLCIFPVEIPGSIQPTVAVAAVVAAAACIAEANCFAVRVATSPPAVAVAPMAAIAGATAAVSLLATTALTGGIVWHGFAGVHDLEWSVIVTLPGFVLFFWLLQRMTATRMTTRFVIAPLVAILFSIALNRPTLDLRTYAGLLLIAAGASWLLFAPAQESDKLTLNR